MKSPQRIPIMSTRKRGRNDYVGEWSNLIWVTKSKVLAIADTCTDWLPVHALAPPLVPLLCQKISPTAKVQKGWARQRSWTLPCNWQSIRIQFSKRVDTRGWLMLIKCQGDVWVGAHLTICWAFTNQCHLAALHRPRLPWGLPPQYRQK